MSPKEKSETKAEEQNKQVPARRPEPTALLGGNAKLVIGLLIGILVPQTYNSCAADLTKTGIFDDQPAKPKKNTDARLTGMMKMFGVDESELADDDDLDPDLASPAELFARLTFTEKIKKVLSSLSIKTILLTYAIVLIIFGVTGYVISGMNPAKP